MPADFDHNKIIIQTARSILKPHGLFQKGSSRMWIDDNGWYLTLVEFQPSNWGRGSYLNVGINFLWREQDYLSFDFGDRVHDFVSAEGSADFRSEVERLAKLALEKVLEYRKFRDIGYACDAVLNNKALGTGIEIHRLYHRMMLCGLAQDPRAKIFCDALWEDVWFSHLPFQVDYRQELTDQIRSIIADKRCFQSYIQHKIASQRALWRSKSSMKKLNPEWEFL